MNICGICNQPEGNDPKAHTCEFNCGACGQYFEQDQADENNHHLAEFCDASEGDELSCAKCGWFHGGLVEAHAQECTPIKEENN